MKDFNTLQQTLAGESQDHAAELPGQRVGRRETQPERDRLLVLESEPGLPQDCVQLAPVDSEVLLPRVPSPIALISVHIVSRSWLML